MAQHLLDRAGVVVIAGSAYGYRDHFRASFSLSESVICAAVEAIAHAVDSLS